MKTRIILMLGLCVCNKKPNKYKAKKTHKPKPKKSYVLPAIGITLTVFAALCLGLGYEGMRQNNVIKENKTGGLQLSEWEKLVVDTTFLEYKRDKWLNSNSKDEVKKFVEWRKSKSRLDDFYVLAYLLPEGRKPNDILNKSITEIRDAVKKEYNLDDKLIDKLSKIGEGLEAASPEFALTIITEQLKRIRN